MAEEFIPVCEPLLGERERAYAGDALASGWISSGGQYVGRFEDAFAAWCGAAHGVAVVNGTAALHLALVALGVGPGDEVIVPAFTMIASAAAVCHAGARPVFVDAEPVTWNIDPGRIAEKVTERTKAVMAVHLYGHPCEMDAIRELAGRAGLAVLEDAAEAHGAEYRGARAGALGDAAAFSFYANKILATGEGGMVVTGDDGVADRCRWYRNLCFPREGGRVYRHDDVGFNYRMTNLHAAIGLAQAERADELRAMRRRVAGWYRDRLEAVPGITLQPELPGCLNVRWMNAAVVEAPVLGVGRDGLAERLRDAGIDTRTFFEPMHLQGAMRARGAGGRRGEFPVAERLARDGILLPSGSGLREGQVDRVCREILAARAARPV